MKRIFGLALLGAIAAAPVALEAQAPRAPQGQEQRMRAHGANPVARILEHRGELALTADQVSSLEAIQQRLQQQNAPHLEQLRAVRAGREGRQSGQTWQRGQGARAQREVPAELRPVMEQVRQNNQAALEQARAVLTAEQQVRLLELAPQRGGKRQRPAR